ncbi:MAG: transcriptional antiterminator RfaH [Gammaproteobacteria bacterium]
MRSDSVVDSHKGPSSSVVGKNWYLCYTKPRSEQQASVNLQRQGYINYLPLYRESRNQRGKLVTKIEPMFPRYIFVALDTETDNWAPIRSTFGVSALVRFGLKPALVADELISILMKKEDDEGVQSAPMREFESGQSVRVHSGPFKDYEGIFLAKNSNERVFVLLEVLGKESRLSINPNQIVGS